jgi:hypothetical protein
MENDTMRITSRLATAMLAAVTVACADSSTAPGNPDALKSPVGTFDLATVNGTKVPMQWHQIEISKGFYLRSYWVGGKIEFKPDSTFAITFQHKLTGPGLPGTVKSNGYSGTWRMTAGAKIEVRPTTGGVGYWETTDQIFTVTVRSSAPDLEGKPEQVVFVFVR